MTHVASEQGAESITVGQVVQRAGVSRRTFYEQFSSSEECLLAAMEEAFAELSGRVSEVYGGAEPWKARIYSALLACLHFLDEKRAAGRLLVVESLRAGEHVLGRRQEALAQAIAAIDEGRHESRRGSQVSPLLAEAVVGGVLSLLHARIACAEQEPLTPLAHELMSMIVLPYLGVGAAQRELERPLSVGAEVSRRMDAALLSDPFKDAGMRLTYRTICALNAIAAHPGCSNRQIGALAGANDQGQVSKLLGRLERLGLICNGGTRPMKGEPNAWELTDTGRQLHKSIRARIEADPANGGTER